MDSLAAALANAGRTAEKEKGRESMKLPMETLRDLLEYHYSRRERVYQFLATIKPEDFTRPVNVGWNSIRGLLMHCLFAEEFWVQHAIRKQPRPDFDSRTYPDVASVRGLAGEVRERTLAFLAALPEAELAREETVTFSSGTVRRFTLAKAFLHIITHDTHHRGQVMALARQLGYEPPEIDLM